MCPTSTFFADLSNARFSENHDKGFIAVLSPYAQKTMIQALGPGVPIALAANGALFYWSFCPEEFLPADCVVDPDRGELSS